MLRKTISPPVVTYDWRKFLLGIPCKLVNTGALFRVIYTLNVPVTVSFESVQAIVKTYAFTVSYDKEGKACKYIPYTEENKMVYDIYPVMKYLKCYTVKVFIYTWGKFTPITR